LIQEAPRMADSANDHALDSTAPLTAFEALRRYHAAEKRLAEVEAQIEAWAVRTAFDRRRDWNRHYEDPPPTPSEPLAALLLERDRLQAESFRVYMAARRAS
jgi:hypothetical protein